MKNNLDNVLLSPAAVAAWQQVAAKMAMVLKELGDTKAAEIPNEDCEELPDGSLRIFVRLPNGIEASLTVPPDDWAWRMPKN